MPGGWTVPAGDPQAFVQMAVALAREPGRVARAAGQARASVEPLDWPQITLQVEALFLRAMELHRSGHRGLEAAQWGAKSSVAAAPAGSLSSKLSRNVNQIDVKNIEAMKSTAG